jgi:TolB protein
MKILKILLLCITTLITAKNNIELAVSGAQQMRMPITIFVSDTSTAQLEEVANIIKKDLTFTDQFKPCIKKYTNELPKKTLRAEIQQLAQSGTPLALHITASSDKTMEWRLYETMGCAMLQGKKYTKKGPTIRGWAHNIADHIRKTLTGNNAIFSSQIAYCKNTHDHNGKPFHALCIADFDGTNEEVLVHSSHVLVAPRWNRYTPEIFYSQYTDTNIQLMSVNTKNKKTTKNISPFDSGINMLVSVAENGKDYAFCASRGNGNCQIYLNKNGVLKRCTKNTGNNTSPIIMDTERVLFCSDFQKGNPQLYIGNIKSGHLQRITRGGYCTSPHYCPETNMITYHQMIRGTMQIMLYDCATKTHTQFTDDSGNKHESSLSPDGTYVLYSHEGPHNVSRLAVSHLASKKRTYITSPHDYCNYPNWSA